MTEERRVQLVAEVDTTRTKQGFSEIGQQAESMATKVKAAGDRAQKGVDNIGAGAERSATQVERAQRSIANAIQRTTVAMETGGRTSAAYYEALAQQRGVDPQKLAPYLNQLRAIEGQQKNVEMSARQTAAALRGVPAQLTDIVTSLQGGQQPLTVFLQQGGQLRDMFGSAGAAAKALSQTVVGLINPFTIAAAAVVAIGVAYNQGSKEADEFNKSLAKTGNAAGTTTAQLTDMAASIRATGAATQGAAAESLAALAATGKVARGNLESFATTAIKANKLLDQSIQDTAKNFADLGKSPLKASEQLNESLNYLTSSVYAQIKALEELGKTNEAAEVAQRAYASALDERADKIKGQLGTIEKAWQGVTGFAKKAWDAMLDVGRDDTPEEKLKKVQGQIAKLQANRFTFIGAGEARERLPGLKAEEASIERQIALQKTMAGLDAEKARFNAADIAWMKAGDEYLTKKEKKEREIAKVREMGLAAGRSDEEIRAREAEVAKKYEEKQSSDAKAAFNDRVNSQIEAIKRRGDVEETVAQRSLDALEANRAAGFVTERDYIESVAQLQEAAFIREKARLEAELELIKQKPNSEKDQAALRGQIAAAEEKSLTRRLKAQNELATLEAKETRAAIAASVDRVERIEAGNAALGKQIEAQRQANDQIGMSKQEQADYNMALAEEAATRKEVEAGILDTIVGREAEADALRENAKLIRESAKAARDGILKAADFEQQRAFWSSLEDVAHQTFVSIVDGGKNAAQRLKDTFKNIFFDWLYQMTVKKWIVNISGQSTGMSFFGNAGGTTDFLSIGKTIYQGFSGGIASSLGGIISSLGNMFGSQAMSAFGSGLSMAGPQAAAASGAFSAAGNTTAAGSISAGSSIGAAIPIAGWIAAGMSIANNLYKSGFKETSTISKSALPLPLVAESLLFNNVFKAIGLSNKTANLLSGASIATALFGRKSPVIESQGIRGTITTGGFSGEDFANILQKGGLFRSDKRSVQTAAIVGDRDRDLDAFVTGAVDSIRALGKSLGAETSVIDGYSKQINLTLGKDEAENKAAIEKAFGGIADDLANLLVPNLAQFSREGETAATTLQRVATEFQLVGASLTAIGADVDKSFGAIGIASLAARERLVSLAGGIDALVSQTDFFSQNFLTEEQRIAPVQKQVDEALAALGQSGLKTSEQFSAAVLALTTSGKLATEEGAKLYTGLLAIAPQFKAVADYLEKTRKEAEELAAAETATQVQKLADALRSVNDAAQSAFNDLSAAIDRQKETVKANYGAIIDQFSRGIDGIAQAMDRTRGVITRVRDALNTFALPGLEAQTRANARERLSAIARSGQIPDESTLSTAISNALQFNEEDFATAFDFRKAQSETRNDLLSIGSAAENQLSAQERSLEVVAGWRAEYEAKQAIELANLDSQLSVARSQLDALLGIDSGVKSLASAQASFSAFMSLAQNTATTANPTAGGLSLTQLYQSALGRAPDESGYAFWSKQFGDSIDANEVKQFLAGAKTELAGRGYRGSGATSNSSVPRSSFGPVFSDEMLALSRSMPTTAPARVQSGGALPSTWSGVEARLESLETVMATGLMNVAAYSKATADTLEQFNLQGLPAER